MHHVFCRVAAALIVAKPEFRLSHFPFWAGSLLWAGRRSTSPCEHTDLEVEWVSKGQKTA